MELSVQKRHILGKATKSLRKSGLVPAELYGHNTKNNHLSIVAKDFKKIFKEAGENTVINLLLDKQNFPALIYDVQTDNLTGEFQHVDFYAIKMDEKIKTKIPLEFIGESPAVKQGGVLVKLKKEIEIESLPADLPGAIKVNLEKLAELHSSIYVKDLALPAKIKIFLDPETTIATIIEQTKEEVVAPTANIEDVKVEGEEKKKEKEKTKETNE